MKLERAVRLVDRAGILLVYPLANRSEPPSLWQELYQTSTMSWSWDGDADPRVADVWHMREKLARSGKVAYAKWFRGRATLFSLPVFHAMLGRLAAAGDPLRGLSPEATSLLESLRERSPLSTKELRAATELQGRVHERAFTSAMKDLWTRLAVVGVGEVQDGAFPSLAVAATELAFEDLWTARHAVPRRAGSALDEALARSKSFAKEMAKSLAVVTAHATATRAARSGGSTRKPGPSREPGPGISMKDELDEAQPRRR